MFNEDNLLTAISRGSLINSLHTINNYIQDNNSLEYLENQGGKFKKFHFKSPFHINFLYKNGIKTDVYLEQKLKEHVLKNIFAKGFKMNFAAKKASNFIKHDKNKLGNFFNNFIEKAVYKKIMKYFLDNTELKALYEITPEDIVPMDTDEESDMDGEEDMTEEEEDTTDDEDGAEGPVAKKPRQIPPLKDLVVNLNRVVEPVTP
jgi:hypothetical protein